MITSAKFVDSWHFYVTWVISLRLPKTLRNHNTASSLATVLLSYLNFFSFLKILTLFRMGFLEAALGTKGSESPPLHENFHTCPEIMKLGTVILYLKTIQKIYQSMTHLLSSGDISTFFRKSTNFAISRNTDIYCILIYNF